MRGGVPVRVAPLTAQTAAAWVALFEGCGVACFCRYWHFAGGKNEWLARCFERPAENRDEQLARLGEGSDEAKGLVAVEGGVVVGWMKLAPRAIVGKLRRQGAYRGLDLGSDDGVWSIGCFLVHPEHRRRGVARALIEAADAQVRAWGGKAIEAYPHRAGYALRDEEAWMGPEGLLVKQGYVATHEDGPYPVYRKDLG
jgi:GNAT superfamily N-acetyltransferase